MGAREDMRVGCMPDLPQLFNSLLCLWGKRMWLFFAECGERLGENLVVLGSRLASWVPLGIDPHPGESVGHAWYPSGTPNPLEQAA